MGAMAVVVQALLTAPQVALIKAHDLGRSLTAPFSPGALSREGRPLWRAQALCPLQKRERGVPPGEEGGGRRGAPCGGCAGQKEAVPPPLPF